MISQTMTTNNHQNNGQYATKTEPKAQTLALLTFKVARQEYGLPVTSVVRIIEMVTITHLPGAPNTIQGIINLQGRAVPVIDLRRRFGLPLKPYGLHTPIILVDVDEGSRMMGLIVDMVEYVRDINPENLEIAETIVPAQLAGQMAVEAAHLAGVAKIDRQMILILNVRALLTQTEQSRLSKVMGNKN